MPAVARRNSNHISEQRGGMSPSAQAARSPTRACMSATRRSRVIANAQRRLVSA